MAPSSLSRLFLLVRVSPLEGRSFALFLTTSPLLPAPRSRCWTVSKESARKRNTQWAARPYVAVEAHSAALQEYLLFAETLRYPGYDWRPVPGVFGMRDCHVNETLVQYVPDLAARTALR